MLSVLADRYNRIRKEKYFKNRLFNTEKKYAIVGVGIHSLNNIYPVLSHFRITLKYICTKQSRPDPVLLRLFPGCSFTNNIGDICNDPEIEGVFVCSAPSAHFSILSELLRSQKNVWVEKPPCQTLAELKQLIAINGVGICKVGFQRRYWPANKHIIGRRKSFKTYRYTFRFGPYVQGDIYTELFIHALDYCSFLFGDSSLQSFHVSAYDNNVTVHLHVMHNDISGLIELSGHGSWNACVDRLMINCTNESLDIQYPFSIISRKNPKRILGIPGERILGQPVTTKELFNANKLLLPVPESNTLVLQGFYDELKNFFSLVEKTEKTPADTNDLPGLLSVYELLDKIKKTT